MAKGSPTKAKAATKVKAPAKKEKKEKDPNAPKVGTGPVLHSSRDYRAFNCPRDLTPLEQMTTCHAHCWGSLILSEHLQALLRGSAVLTRLSVTL